ncbi:crotonobetainyl-CoA:carnitine CoA-transferase CaiB-like acyl-CoA transferase [Mycolicibacterium sp. BK556]|uniref:CaiB/BaiF CoA-transferase family protein n=1 Tax=unclassified Mycolicibacterium TaxID=2636767 RepID=UPI0016199DD2|nr:MULTISPECIES: CoA transferase [unclassified Mycolicibacterium]MBB3602152.1 crotonobetainyl-CoA:carnitine CoA-transferase CaiB-like acyl-CoA transferase [Mycolicibacterium sp. BK556]MBB3631904.1 crotonobetainyl-CoA:carnitine CoA-transferase CaiB-like acyl-CoA transferase [Mycolicibacterium sp. BK607]
MTSPLSGIRVLEIGDRIATAYCGKLLRDAGADVVMVEPPAGHRLRRYRPAGVPPSAGDSPFFSFLSGGKRSISSPTVPPELVDSADIVILGATPAEAADLGFDVDEIACRTSVITVSNFGWSGPWIDVPATEFTLQAWCGSTGSRGEPERPPIAVGGDLGEFIAGSYAAFFALAAHRGGGPFDMSVLEAMTTSMQVFSWLRKELMLLEVLGRSTEVPSVERAKDGYVGISMATGQQWQDFCAMVECPDLADVPELRFQVGRWEQRDLIRARTADFFATHTVAEIVELAALFRIPMTAIGNGETLSSMDHFIERESFLHHPSGFRAPRAPWRMSATPPLPPALPPALGDTESPWTPRESRAERTSLPLDGVRIVDLTAFWAGPTATHLLGMLGADVVKIESVQRPDGMRFAGGFREDVERWWEYSWVFHGVNSGKRSITLDLGSEEGRALFGRMVAEADVVVENFTPRVMENFGLSYDELRGFNEQIIEVRMPGFGLDGPWRDRVGFAMTMEQLAGLAWLTGYPDGLPTAPRGACDPLAGVHAAFLTLAALEHRRRTGQGQLVELPMIDVVLNASALQVIERDVAGVLLTRRGNRGHEFAVQNVYACAGDDQWIAVSVRGNDDWHALKAVLGQPVWAHDLIYAEGTADLIDGHLADWCKDQARDETVSAFLAAGIPAAPVVQPPDVIDNAALQARGFFQTVDHPLCGPLPYPRPPVTGHFVNSAAPLLGQDNAEILGSSLGLTAQDFARLEDDKVIGSWPLGL